ncbi:MAG: hypothetical protein LBV34_27405, partial [Nocardiopsaceae bacterium]|nr:hypothetical protein [Nocardiopsaceae bacterium]
MKVLRTTRGSLAASAAIATVACGGALAGCGIAQAGCATAHQGTAPVRATWGTRMVLAEPGSLGIVSQVVNTGTKTDF